MANLQVIQAVVFNLESCLLVLVMYQRWSWCFPFSAHFLRTLCIDYPVHIAQPVNFILGTLPMEENLFNIIARCNCMAFIICMLNRQWSAIIIYAWPV